MLQDGIITNNTTYFNRSRLIEGKSSNSWNYKWTIFLLCEKHVKLNVHYSPKESDTPKRSFMTFVYVPSPAMMINSSINECKPLNATVKILKFLA